VTRRSFGRKLLGLIIGLALLILLALDGTRVVGGYMPFSVERNMASNYVADLPKPDERSAALDAFAEKLASLQGLAPGIAVEVHVIPVDSVQAFATLGGHILLYRGLLRSVQNEDTLATVLAHQIAHINHRHAAGALGRRVSLGLMLSLVSQDWAENFAKPSFHSSLRTAPDFLAEHETAVLRDTGATLFTLYGHLGGAVDLANTLRKFIAAGEKPRILETHPGIERLDEAFGPLSQEMGWPMGETGAKRRPLPAVLNFSADTAQGPATTQSPSSVPSKITPAATQ
jgi:hypothetical protein